MTTQDLPKSIRSEVLNIFGIDLHVHVLDNGQRIIDEQDVVRLFTRMSEDDCPAMTQRECDVLARFITKGIE